jgi:hypothetical protein
LFDPFWFQNLPNKRVKTSYCFKDILTKLLSEDFNFHGENSTHAAYNFRAFSAKF